MRTYFSFVIFSLLGGILFSSTAVARTANPSETAITIYSKASPGAVNPDIYRPVPGQNNNFYYNQIPGYAYVKQQRSVMLNQIKNAVEFQDVAAYIDPTSVMFKSLTHPEATHVIEQNYQYDLVSSTKLLQRFLGESISVEQQSGNEKVTHKGKLISVLGSGLILEQDNGKLLSLNHYQNIIFPKLPGGLIIKPTLSWLIETRKKGQHQVEVSYKTDALTWWADYNLIYKEDTHNSQKGEVDISAWVSIINQSGLSYDNTKLKIVAGDVQTIQQAHVRRPIPIPEVDYITESTGHSFKQKAFFEYHLYQLERAVSLPNNSTKQLELFNPVFNVPVKKEYRYDTRLGEKVGVYITFDNIERHDMGIPLPAGRVRTSKRDTADHSLEFIGESVIDHTPKDEEVTIKLGNAFDITAKRILLNQETDRTTRKVKSQTYQLQFHNHKDQSIILNAIEPLRSNANWRITQHSHQYKKKDAHTIHFPVKIPENKEILVEYTVTYH